MLASGANPPLTSYTVTATDDAARDHRPPPRGAARSVAAARRSGARRLRALPRHRSSRRIAAPADAGSQAPRRSPFKTVKVDDSADAVRAGRTARRRAAAYATQERLVGDQRDARHRARCRATRCWRPRRRSALPAARGSRSGSIISTARSARASAASASAVTDCRRSARGRGPRAAAAAGAGDPLPPSAATAQADELAARLPRDDAAAEADARRARRAAEGARRSADSVDARHAASAPSFERPSFELRVRGSFTAKGERVYARHAARAAIRCATTCRSTGSAWRAGSSIANNPLVARVAVNRLWEQLFGRGLVETSEDFGSQGAPPTHPELLDWLATEFVAKGWSQKALLRTIVMSATYRQSSAVPAAARRARPLQPPARARAARPAGGRDDPRRRAGGERPAQREDGRPERLPAAAGRHLEHAVQRATSGRRATARTATAAASTPSGAARRRTRAS